MYRYLAIRVRLSEVRIHCGRSPPFETRHTYTYCVSASTVIVRLPARSLAHPAARAATVGGVYVPSAAPSSGCWTRRCCGQAQTDADTDADTGTLPVRHGILGQCVSYREGRVQTSLPVRYGTSEQCVSHREGRVCRHPSLPGHACLRGTMPYREGRENKRKSRQGYLGGYDADT